MLGENWACLYPYCEYSLWRRCSDAKRALLRRSGPLCFTAGLLGLCWLCLIIYLGRFWQFEMFPCFSDVSQTSHPPLCGTGTYSASVVLFGSSLCFYLSPCCQFSSSCWTAARGCISSSLCFFKTSAYLKSLKHCALQPQGVVAKQHLVKCFGGVLVHLICHFVISSNERHIIKLPVLLLCPLPQQQGAMYRVLVT